MPLPAVEAPSRVLAPVVGASLVFRELQSPECGQRTNKYKAANVAASAATQELLELSDWLLVEGAVDQDETLDLSQFDKCTIPQFGGARSQSSGSLASLVQNLQRVAEVPQPVPPKCHTVLRNWGTNSLDLDWAWEAAAKDLLLGDCACAEKDLMLAATPRVMLPAFLRRGSVPRGSVEVLPEDGQSPDSATCFPMHGQGQASFMHDASPRGRLAPRWGSVLMSEECVSKEYRIRAETAFCRLCAGGLNGRYDVELEAIPWALRFAGCLIIRPDWFMQLKEHIFQKDGFTFAGFMQMAHTYRERCTKHLSNKYHAGSRWPNSGGHVFGSEALGQLLSKDFGLTAFPWLLEDLMQEGLASMVEDSCHGSKTRAEEDDDSEPRLSSETFHQLAAELQLQAGWSKLQSGVLSSVFFRCRGPACSEGQLDPEGLRASLLWLGDLAWMPADLLHLLGPPPRRVTACTDTSALQVLEQGIFLQDDGNDQPVQTAVLNQGPVSEAEFLVIAAACYRRRVETAKAAFNKCSPAPGASFFEGGSSFFPTEHLITTADAFRVFGKLQWVPVSAELMAELVVATGHGGDRFNFAEFVLLLERFRERHGFSNAELKDIDAAFATFCGDSRESIDHAEALGALRWLGFATNASEMLMLEAELRLMDRNKLYFQDFQRLAASYRDLEVLRLREALAGCMSSNGHVLTAKMSMEIQIVSLATYAEYLVALEMGAAAGATVDLPHLCRQARLNRIELRRNLRRRCFFSGGEVAQFRTAFQELDRVGVGLTSDTQFAQGAVQLCGARCSLGCVARAQVLLREAAAMAGAAAFADFLWVARLMKDYAALEQCRRQYRAAEDTGFAPAEVLEFRNIFGRSEDPTTGLAGFQDIAEMLLEALPCFADNKDEVRGAILWILSLFNGAGNDASLDFAEFLRAMRHFEDHTWPQSTKAKAASEASSASVHQLTNDDMISSTSASGYAQSIS